MIGLSLSLLRLRSHIRCPLRLRAVFLAGVIYFMTWIFGSSVDCLKYGLLKKGPRLHRFATISHEAGFTQPWAHIMACRSIQQLIPQETNDEGLDAQRNREARRTSSTFPLCESDWQHKMH